MEKIFWLMWLSDILGNISVIGFLAWCAAGGTVVFVSAMTFYHPYDEEDFERVVKVARWLALPMALGLMVPNSSTIKVLIVAEAAQVAASTQIGSKTLQALDEVLNKFIRESKAKISEGK